MNAQANGADVDLGEHTEAAETQIALGGLTGIGGDELTDLLAEQQLLGLIMLDATNFGAIEELIFEDDFFLRIHRHLFVACRQAFSEGYDIGPKALIRALGGPDVPLFADGTTAPKYISKLMSEADGANRLIDLAAHLHDMAEKRAAEQEDMANAPDEPQTRFGAVRFRDLDKPGPEYDYLVKGILTRFERSLLVGPSMSGKSFVAVEFAMAVALGEPFQGRRTRKGLVLYQAGEGALGLKKRLRAARKERGLPADADLPLVTMTSPVDLYANDADTVAFIKEAQQWAALYKYDQNVDLELIVIDTLSAATPGANENASEDVSKVLSRLALIAKHCKCHVMLVHHLNAAGSKPRGHTSLFANIENAIEVSLTEQTNDAVADDGHTIKRKVRLAKVTKQKDGEDGIDWKFVLKQVELGKDIDGDPITSCVVVPLHADTSVTAQNADAGKKETPAGFKLTPQEAMFFESFLEAVRDHGVPAPATLGLPTDVRVVDYIHVKDVFKKKMLREDDDTEEGRKRHAGRVKMALKRARETLQQYRVIASDAPFIWHTGKTVRGFDLGRFVKARPAPDDLGSYEGDIAQEFG